jgi:Tol biopolymer transport system component
LSGITDFAADGSEIVFWEAGEGSSPNGADVFIRNTDGSPAIGIAEGVAALSPDKSYILAIANEPEQLVLIPTRVGQTKPLERSGITTHLAPSFLPDGKQIVFAGDDGHGWRLYLQDEEGANLKRSRRK